MKKKFDFIKNNYLFILSFVLIFVSSYVLSRFSIWAADDYAFYNNVWNGVDKFSLFRVFDRANTFYLNWTGRYVSTIVNYILLYFDKEVFNVLNACVNTYFIYIMYKLINVKKWYIPIAIYCVSWLLIPSYGQVMLWQIGSVIYLWMSCLGLTVLYFFNKMNSNYVINNKAKSVLIMILLLIFSIISGNGFETNSIVLISFMFLYLFKLIINKSKNRISKYQIFIFVGTTIGFLTNLLSPGNKVRMTAMNNGQSIIQKLVDGLGLWYYNGIFRTLLFIILPIFLLLFLCYINHNKKDEKWYKSIIILLISFIASLFSFSIIAIHRNQDNFLISYWENLYRYDIVILLTFSLLLCFGLIIYFFDKKIIKSREIYNFNMLSLYFIAAMIGVAAYIVTPSAWCRSYMFMIIFLIISGSLIIYNLNFKFNFITKIIFLVFIGFFCFSFFNGFNDIYHSYIRMNEIKNQIYFQIDSGDKKIYVDSMASTNSHNSASIEKWVIPPEIADKNMATENGIHKYYEWINIEITNYYFNDKNAWNNGFRIIGKESE